MKVYIFADMEGISGISCSDFVLTEKRLYAEGRRLMTEDINACVRGCFAGGADGVIVRDGHSSGINVLWEQLDPRAELVQGDSAGIRYPGIEECGALILLGYHAMAGVKGALLEHSYTSAGVQNLWMNGKLVGEFAVDAAIAGELGVPVIMTSGDDHLCAEAKAVIPAVAACQVKAGLSTQGARLLPALTAHARIEKCAAEAVRTAGKATPYKVSKPATLKVEFLERHRLPTGRRGVQIIDGRTIEATADTVAEALDMVFG